MAAVTFDFGAYVKEGVDVFTSNLVPCIVFIILLCVPFLGIIAAVNFMTAVKAYKENGTAIEIGALLNFDNAVNILIGVIVWAVVLMIGFALLFIPGLIWALLTYMFLPILANKPDQPWADALKTALAFGKQNIVGSLILMIICGVVGMFWITIPIGMAAQMLAFLAHKDAILAGPSA